MARILIVDDNEQNLYMAFRLTIPVAKRGIVAS